MIGIRTCSLHLLVFGTYRSGTVLESNQFPQSFLLVVKITFSNSSIIFSLKKSARVCKVDNSGAIIYKCDGCVLVARVCRYNYYLTYYKYMADGTCTCGTPTPCVVHPATK